MCTVTFIATKDAFILTSNRDEQTVRAAIAPQNYIFNNQNLYFPKDPQSGGTWFAVNKNGAVLVLLNGAEEKHPHNPPYQRSRGLVVLEMVSNINPIFFWNDIDLENVEPFTLILFQSEKLYQLRWNGTEKSQKNLNVDEKHIYSSSTLYSKTVREERAKWFYEFTALKTVINQNDLLDFHQNTHASNCQNGLVINRLELLKTLSITQSIIKTNQIELVYKDLIHNKSYSDVIEIAK